jgi:hypothetical protein
LKRPTELEWLLYGGGLLMAAGSAAIYAPAGLIVLGAWFSYLGRLYVLQSRGGREK